MSEKLNRQKNADEKKMIVAQHREKQLECKRQIEIQKSTRVEFCLHPCVLFQVCTFLRLSG